LGKITDVAKLKDDVTIAGPVPLQDVITDKNGVYDILKKIFWIDDIEYIAELYLNHLQQKNFELKTRYLINFLSSELKNIEDI
jgi:hypothetical protein